MYKISQGNIFTHYKSCHATFYFFLSSFSLLPVASLVGDDVIHAIGCEKKISILNFAKRRRKKRTYK